MELPLITIGITSYNHASYIQYALDSVLNEDYPNKEIAIIDDGSTDNSPQIIQNWINANKDKIKVRFVSRQNKGLVYTMNELIDMIESDYIALLASDDALYNNGLLKRMLLMQKLGKLAVVGDSSVIDNQNTLTHQSWMKDAMKRDVSLYKTERGIMKEVLVNPAISGSVLLLHKKIYQKIGKYPSNFYAEDHFFYHRCAAFKQMAYLDEVVSLYRRHDSNASGSNQIKTKHIIKSIVKNYWLNWSLFPGVEMKALAFKQWLKWKYMYLRTYIIK